MAHGSAKVAGLLTISQVPLGDLTDAPDVTLGDLALKWTTQESQDLPSYKVLSIEPFALKGQNAVKVTYVYVTEPALPTPNSIPIVAEGQDVLLIQGDQLTIARFLADADVYDQASRTWDRVLASVQLK